MPSSLSSQAFTSAVLVRDQLKNVNFKCWRSYLEFEGYGGKERPVQIQKVKNFNG